MKATIGTRFETLRAEGRKALVPYLMSGFPDRRRFLELLAVVEAEGADLIEIGFPFSDPLADGPIIQAAGQRALDGGTSVASTLDDLEAAAATAVPRIAMSYLNPLVAFGLDAFARRGRRLGIRGWIVPDADLDRRREVLDPAARHAIDFIPLLAPTSPDSRIRTVLRDAGGFVYLVSLTGVTGPRRGRKLQLSAYVRRVRALTDLPLCIGFGVADAEQARAAGRLADGVVVGSALLEPFLRLSYPRARREMIRRLREIRRGLERG